MRPKADSAKVITSKRSVKTVKDDASSGATDSSADLLGPIAEATTASTRDNAKAKLPGGRALHDQLVKLGITREQDLALHLPLRYEDHTRLVPLHAIAPGAAVQ